MKTIQSYYISDRAKENLNRIKTVLFEQEGLRCSNSATIEYALDKAIKHLERQQKELVR